MFIRQQFKTVSGKRVAYWALVESYRTERGPRQRVVAWLGKLDESDRHETKFVSQTRAEYLNERADSRDARAKELETELPGLLQQISEAETRERTIRERMLAP